MHAFVHIRRLPPVYVQHDGPVAKACKIGVYADVKLFLYCMLHWVVGSCRGFRQKVRIRLEIE